MSVVAHARLDADGVLVAADLPVLLLQRGAGGELLMPVMVPALAVLARLAQGLGTPVARHVRVAHGDQDVSLHATATPDPTGVSLALDQWLLSAPRQPLLGQAPPSAPTPAAGAFDFVTDEALAIDGVAFGNVFRLLPDDHGSMALLTALAHSAAFAGQRAERIAVPGSEVVVSGRPEFDAQGRFTGLRGRATPCGPDDEQRPGDFASRLDTALRSPLARIIGHADAIVTRDSGPLRQDYADYAGDIASAARHLLGLVDDLGDLEAVERADLVLDSEAIDLAEIARRAAGLLQARGHAGQVRIDRPGDHETLGARGDYGRVLQIAINLIANAVRYSPPGASVWLRTESEGDMVAMIVADQGKGIAPGDLVRIFDKFERVDSGEPGGSGLGLYIARRLARAMGGDITVDSAPGQGARFVLTLPAAASAA